MLVIFTLALGFLTSGTEASVASDCLRFLVDEEFHVPCADEPSTSRNPCLVSTEADQEYLKRFGIVSDPGDPLGEMICAPNGDLNDVDCVSTKLHSNKKTDWMWTEWEQLSSGMVTRTMYYVDNGATVHCPYKQTTLPPPIELRCTMDDYGAIYADGVLVADNIRWATFVTVNLSGLTRLLAFKLGNNGGATGVVALLSNGVVSDTSKAWRCSQVYEEGWNQLGFDDSQWGDVDAQGF